MVGPILAFPTNWSLCRAVELFVCLFLFCVFVCFSCCCLIFVLQKVWCCLSSVLVSVDVHTKSLSQTVESCRGLQLWPQWQARL